MNVLLWALLLTPELTKPDDREIVILFMVIVCGLYLYGFGATLSDMAAAIRRASIRETLAPTARKTSER